MQRSLDNKEHTYGIIHKHSGTNAIGNITHALLGVLDEDTAKARMIIIIERQFEAINEQFDSMSAT